MSVLPVIIDTDPGLGEVGSVIDDGLAIAFALASPELDILGLTIVNGNVDAATGYGLARRLLERLDRADVPVHLGAEAPMRQHMATVWDTFRSGKPSSQTADVRPLDDVPREAASWLVQQAAKRPGEITIAAIGPLTNIAKAIQQDPAFATNVREVVIMGGNATGTLANGVQPLPDFNVFVDPDAADIVLRSGVTVRLIGIDQTSRVFITEEDTQWLRTHGRRVAAWLADCIDSWIARPEASDEREGFCLLHDPLVIAAVIEPDLCEFAPLTARVDVAQGEIHLDGGTKLPTHVSAAVDTDTSAVRALFLDRLAAT